MTPEQKQERRAYELFEQALEHTPEERAAFLADACGSDAELRAEVESLLEHDSRAADGFLLPPEPPPDSGSAVAAGQPDPLVGSHVGSFHIKQVIASGGMGTVYEAVQEHPHRTVALKVMHRNVASRSALRRFQFEAQILGRLRHPNIAQVIQAGMHDDDSGGVPYFAMEYIPGARPITHYAKEKGLNTADRLELLAKTCDAVHHGHQKGIIHRDLKPANILVDSAGEPKVIDFGVARATDSDLSITTQQTDIGQLVGTMQYMSPEQCDADPHDLDTRNRHFPQVRSVARVDCHLFADPGGDNLNLQLVGLDLSPLNGWRGARRGGRVKYLLRRATRDNRSARGSRCSATWPVGRGRRWKATMNDT